MKKFNVKAIAVLVCCVMLISTFATTSFAAEISEKSIDDKAISNDTIYSNSLDFLSDEFVPNEDGCELCRTNLHDIVVQDSLIVSDDASINIVDSKDDFVVSIVHNDSFCINGFISEDEIQMPLEDYYDFSSTSRFHIADWAYRSGFLTEEEKVNIFCDLIAERKFENIDCLEGVFDYIQKYKSNNTISTELELKLEEIFQEPSYNETNSLTREIDNESTYTSTNFTIHYDSDSSTSADAKAVAEYFEKVRTDYINLGFTTPKLQLFKSTYQVYLDPDKHSDNYAGMCFGSATLTNTCASYIVIYGFNGLNTAVKEVIAHEYFHAIQNAYNYQTTWFKEACANWGKIIVGGSSTTCNGKINSFIDSSASMDAESTQYGAVMYPLTIQWKYGTDAIVSIYEKYNDYSAFISDSKLRDVITLGIQDTGSTEGFVTAYRRMASFMYDTSAWYTSVYSGASGWHDAPHTEYTISTTGTSLVTNSTTTITDSLNYLTSSRYELKLPTGFVGALKIEMTYSDDSGKSQIYTIKNTGVHNVHYVATSSDNTSEYIQTGIGKTVNSVVLVVSNTSDGDSVTFSAKITLLPTQSNMYFSSSVKYMERLQYLDAGEVAEYQVTFATSGSKLLQTFGNKDTKMELYSASGSLLASDDDDGYSLNSLIRYYVTEGNTYTIKVYFYSSSNSGETKLSITPAFGALNDGVETLETYENIYAITNSTNFTWNTFAQTNYSRVITFKAPSADEYTFEINSDFDTYIYVIDPRSNSAIVYNVNYNDDSGEGMNPLLTTYLDANIPYLIIYSAYNPGSPAETRDLTLHIIKS